MMKECISNKKENKSREMCSHLYKRSLMNSIVSAKLLQKRCDLKRGKAHKC